MILQEVPFEKLMQTKQGLYYHEGLGGSSVNPQKHFGSSFLAPVLPSPFGLSYPHLPTELPSGMSQQRAYKTHSLVGYNGFRPVLIAYLD